MSIAVAKLFTSTELLPQLALKFEHMVSAVEPSFSLVRGFPCREFESGNDPLHGASPVIGVDVVLMRTVPWEE